MNKQQKLAIHKARELDIDNIVRDYAKAKYYSHSSHINYYAKYDGLEISATFGAGTNSARVMVPAPPDDPLNPLVLYHATDYGRYISVFRYGPWVHRLINETERIQAAQKEIDRAADEQQRQQRQANYEEVDF